jgi:hypothetical protein
MSFIITGDEEGPARFGTLALIEHMRAEGADARPVPGGRTDSVSTGLAT